MSEGVPLSRKEKKTQRDAERHKKGKKRKIADRDEDDLNATEDTPIDAVQGDAKKPSRKSKQSKEDRKPSQGDGDQDAEPASTEPAAASQTPKTKRKAESEDQVDAQDQAAPTARHSAKKRKKDDGTAAESGADGGAQQDATDAKPSKSRFIVFVGNLPFTTTDASLQAHFKKLSPFSLRHRTDQKTKKSKGFAFLEFENYDRMKTCLQLYHHSVFDPEDKENGGSGKGNGKRARKINVELTAGGGGKASGRKEKIKVKNERLEEQRKRKAEARKKSDERREKKEGLKKSAGGSEATQEESKAEPAASHDGMHPSRLALLNV